MRVSCLRIGALRLSLAMILALLIVPGYIVAPALFAMLDTQAMAGEVAGRIFHISMMSCLFLSASVAVFWLRMRKDFQIGKRWLLLFLIALFVAVNLFVLSPMMVEIKAQMGPIDLVPSDDPQRQMFGMWHGISAVFHLLASLIAAGLVALGGVGCSKAENMDLCPKS